MNLFACNIDNSDRINRVVIGALLLIGGLIGLGKIFLMLVGIVLIVQGAIGWCAIPYIRDMIAKKKS